MLKELKAFYKTDARKHLPWRQTQDPYKVLVSEVMLQQTQVDRVIPYFERWIKKYPTAKHLAKASLVDVLKMWQGLGYNRRAKYLWESAKIIAKDGWQEKLPGVGPYTKAAVETFAFNRPNVFVETNIRTVFFYHWDEYSSILQKTRMVADSQLMPLVAEAFKKSKMEPRDFYAALMDYGSYLKKSGVRLNSRSKHYAKQTKFEGSSRQLRGAILRELLAGSKTEAVLIKNLYPCKRVEVVRELSRLLGEGMLKRRGGTYRVD
ncbi:MAG TPA: A/G-specific adenine glycosylase [Candidatus Paceibacterota bacterium]